MRHKLAPRTLRVSGVEPAGRMSTTVLKMQVNGCVHTAYHGCEVRSEDKTIGDVCLQCLDGLFDFGKVAVSADTVCFEIVARFAEE